MNLSTKKQSGLTLFVVATLSALFSSCTDTCETTSTYTYYEAVYKTTEEIRNEFEFQAPRDIEVSGKIYLKGNYVFINEPGKGIHIINNFDKTAPNSEGFINIPGNFDMAALGDIIYADSYIDLLAIDISDLNDIKIVKRVENAFPNNYGYYYEGQPIVVDYVEAKSVEMNDGDCGNNFQEVMLVDNFIAVRADASFQTLNSAIKIGGPTAGIGGSWCRSCGLGERVASGK